MYPVPSEFTQDVNLDLTHFDLLTFDTVPDILIMPSTLGKFAKVRPSRSPSPFASRLPI